jgi:glycine/D-amino acid oxidase-like deaminating enzyme
VWELARRGVRVALVDRGEVSGGSTGLGEGNVLCCDKPDAGPELDLARRGLALYDTIEELLGAEAGIRRKGALLVHPGEAVPDAEAGRLELMRAAGVECEALDREVTQAAEPELSGELAGASWFPHDLQCAPRAIARGLATEAAGLGATVKTGLDVKAIVVRGGRVEGLATSEGAIPTDRVLLAAGAWSAPLAGSAGLALPVEPRKGQLVRLERRPGFLLHKVVEGAYIESVASPAAGLQVSTVMETTMDGHVLVGSSRERRGFDVSVDAAVSSAMLERARRLAPGLAGLTPDDAWAGLRPWLPDGLPALGPSRLVEGLWVATGHEGAGVALGPISGRLAAQDLCGERVEPDLAPFDPDRFAGGP